ncbi:MAG TPA: alpha/beta fold hydrolase [Aquabacterium sp.]|nr:alpha/beta fold hydrolase [Aquabacterium sp.]
MNAGLCDLVVTNPLAPAPIRAIVLYPTLAPTSGVEIGPYHFDTTRDAPLADGIWPLCLISHGGGGSHLLYRSIATDLARHGLVVVCVEHPGDHRGDRSLTGTDQAALTRPAHVSRVLDAMLADTRFGACIAREEISIVGHSMGGYTALALLGGQPWTRRAQPLPVQADARIGRGVLLAPATDWYRAPGALNAVTAPLLVVTGERDVVTPAAAIQQTLAHLPPHTPVSWCSVPDAGHFAFLTPFPAEMVKPDFPPSQDPPGFDRHQFHQALPGIIRRFLSR